MAKQLINLARLDHQPAIKWTVSPFANWSAKQAMSKLVRDRLNLVVDRRLKLNRCIVLSHGNYAHLQIISCKLQKESRSLDAMRTAIFNRPYLDGAIQRV